MARNHSEKYQLKIIMPLCSSANFEMLIPFVYFRRAKNLYFDIVNMIEQVKFVKVLKIKVYSSVIVQYILG